MNRIIKFGYYKKNRMVLHELKSYQGKYFDTMSLAINIVLKDYDINLHPFLDSFMLRTFAFQFDKNNPKLWFSPLISQIDSVNIFKELFALTLDIQINTIDQINKGSVFHELDKMLCLGSVIIGNLDKSKIWNRIDSLYYKGAAYYIVITRLNKNNYIINDPSGCPFMFLSKNKLQNSFDDNNKSIQLIQIKPINKAFEINKNIFRKTFEKGICYRKNIKENDLLLSNGIKRMFNNDFVFKSSHEAIMNFAIPNYSIFLYHLNLFIKKISGDNSFEKFCNKYNRHLAELLFLLQNNSNKSVVLKNMCEIVDYELDFDFELSKLQT